MLIDICMHVWCVFAHCLLLRNDRLSSISNKVYRLLNQCGFYSLSYALAINSAIECISSTFRLSMNETWYRNKQSERERVRHREIVTREMITSLTVVGVNYFLRYWTLNNSKWHKHTHTKFMKKKMFSFCDKLICWMLDAKMKRKKIKS